MTENSLQPFAFTFSLLCYTVALYTLAYFFVWLGNLQCLFPNLSDYFATNIDGRCSVTPKYFGHIFSSHHWVANNVLSMLAFVVQHSVMARPRFKETWTNFVPKSIDRSVYVLFTSIALYFMMVSWIPQPYVLLQPNFSYISTALFTFYFFGAFLLIYSTFLVSHWDLFGLRQSYLGDKYTPVTFTESNLYAYWRHPMMLGFLISTWSFVGNLTVGHVFFSTLITMYIIFGIALEEKTLESELKEYRSYKERVPMFPFFSYSDRIKSHNEVAKQQQKQQQQEAVTRKVTIEKIYSET